MKRRICWIIGLLSVAVISAYGQEKSIDELKVEQATLQAKIQLQEEKKGVTPFTKWSGFGKELGEAFNGFVSAVDGGLKVTTERVNEFAKTDVGRFAMVCIAWKIFGQDAWRLIDIGIGLLLLLAFFYVLYQAIRTFWWGREQVVKRDGPWYNRVVTKERKPGIYSKAGRVEEVCNEDARTTITLIFAVTLVALFIASMCFITP
jgi:hypothetical protein